MPRLALKVEQPDAVVLFDDIEAFVLQAMTVNEQVQFWLYAILRDGSGHMLVKRLTERVDAIWALSELESRRYHHALHQQERTVFAVTDKGSVRPLDEVQAAEAVS